MMNAIQRLRTRARAAGTLRDTPQQQVVVQEEVIRIVPARRDVIYVPRYDHRVVYVSRPFYSSVSFITFGAAWPAGHWLAYDWDWPGRTLWIVPPPRRADYWRTCPDWRFRDHPRPGQYREEWHTWHPHRRPPPGTRGPDRVTVGPGGEWRDRDQGRYQRPVGGRPDRGGEPDYRPGRPDGEHGYRPSRPDGERGGRPGDLPRGPGAPRGGDLPGGPHRTRSRRSAPHSPRRRQRSLRCISRLMADGSRLTPLTSAPGRICRAVTSAGRDPRWSRRRRPQSPRRCRWRRMDAGCRPIQSISGPGRRRPAPT